MPSFLWHMLEGGTVTLFVFLFALCWLEVRWLVRLHRAISAVESLAVLSFVHSWKPTYLAWCKTMGDMRVEVLTRRYHFNFDPAASEKKRDAAP